jgi:hypothetical protein
LVGAALLGGVGGDTFGAVNITLAALWADRRRTVALQRSVRRHVGPLSGHS